MSEKLSLPTMTLVKSSNIHSVGYDGQKRLAYVTFKSGSCYFYEEVEQEDFDKLVLAKSVGSYFSRSFKHNYKFAKLEEEEEEEEEDKNG